MNWDERLTEWAAYARGHGTRAVFRWLHDELIGASDAEVDSPELRWKMTPVSVDVATMYFRNGSTISVVDAPLSVRSEMIMADEYDCEFYPSDKVRFSEEQFYEMLGITGTSRERGIYSADR